MAQFSRISTMKDKVSCILVRLDAAPINLQQLMTATDVRFAVAVCELCSTRRKWSLFFCSFWKMTHTTLIVRISLFGNHVASESLITVILFRLKKHSVCELSLFKIPVQTLYQVCWWLKRNWGCIPSFGKHYPQADIPLNSVAMIATAKNCCSTYNNCHCFGEFIIL